MPGRVEQYQEPPTARLVGGADGAQSHEKLRHLFEIIHNEVEMQSSCCTAVGPLRRTVVVDALEVQAYGAVGGQDNEIRVRRAQLTAEKLPVEVRKRQRIRAIDGDGEQTRDCGHGDLPPCVQSLGPTDIPVVQRHVDRADTREIFEVPAGTGTRNTGQLR